MQILTLDLNIIIAISIIASSEEAGDVGELYIGHYLPPYTLYAFFVSSASLLVCKATTSWSLMAWKSCFLEIDDLFGWRFRS